MRPTSRTRRTSLPLAAGALGGLLFADRPVDAQVGIQACDAAQQRCSGRCVPKTPQTGCGDTKCRQCFVAGAEPACESAGSDLVCGYSKCFADRIDLDGKRTNGCEAIKVGRLVFKIPTTYARKSSEEHVRYVLSEVASGSMSHSGDVWGTGKSFDFTVPPGPVLTEIDRCFALAAALPASATVWLEVRSPTTIFQLPATDNAPYGAPTYNKVVLDVRDGPKYSILCHVNQPPE